MFPARLALIAALAASPATADSVNFEALPLGKLGTNTITVDGVTFIAPEELYNASGYTFQGNGGAICSLDVSEFSCENDLTMRFNGAVRRLRLSTSGYDPGDSVTVTIYRGKTELGEVTVASNRGLNLRRFGRITRIELDDNSTGYGFDYGLIHFRRVPVASAEEEHPPFHPGQTPDRPPRAKRR